jgi:isopentenyl phosphate kinase
MYLKKFSTTVSTNGDDYVVNYHGDNSYGHCIYKKMDLTGTNKPVRQSVMLLTHCQMSDIIGEIDKESPLNESDHSSLSMEIRNHSLQVLHDWFDEK